MKTLLRLLLAVLAVNLVSCVMPPQQGRRPMPRHHPMMPASVAASSHGGSSYEAGYMMASTGSVGGHHHPGGTVTRESFDLYTIDLNRLEKRGGRVNVASGWRASGHFHGERRLITLPNGQRVIRVYGHDNCPGTCRDNPRRSTVDPD